MQLKTPSIWRWTTALCAVALAVTTGGCDDVERYNCGRFDMPGWTAPDACVCVNPEGKSTVINNDGDEIPVRCEDARLQACPSTSGFGCALPLQEQSPLDVDDPAIMQLHLDIGGHLHDLCCAQHFGYSTGDGFSLKCNGCIGASSDAIVDCEAQNPLPLLYGSPESDEHPCFAEWRYATQAPFEGSPFWQAPFDTSMRWTSPEVVARGLAGSPPPYTVPNGGDGAPPMYGRALSPEMNFHGLEQRAPDGQRLGSESLTLPVDEGGLGLFEAQVASFCQSERVELLYDGWHCAPGLSLLDDGDDAASE